MHLCKMKMARSHAPVSFICFNDYMNIGTIIGCPPRG